MVPWAFVETMMVGSDTDTEVIGGLVDGTMIIVLETGTSGFETIGNVSSTPSWVF